MITDRIRAIKARAMTTTYKDMWDHAQAAIRDVSFAQTVGQSPVLREAEATAYYLRHRDIVLHDGELLAGLLVQSKAPAAPKLAANDAGPVSAYLPSKFTPDHQALLDRGVLWYAGNHMTVDYEGVLAEGLTGTMRRIDRRIERLDPREADYAQKREFLTAMRIVAQAAIDASNRHADLADEQARSTADANRRGELATIAANCRAVPAREARTFWEACQSLWFAFYLVPDAPGRIDQYLAPFYEKGLADGTITREFAKELICCLWIKYLEFYGADCPVGAMHHATLGGVKADGSDASNEVTRLCLEVTEELALFRPQVSLRWHAKTPPDLLERAVTALRGRCSHPSFVSDEQIVPALTNVGVSLEDARNFSLSGCNEVTIAGRSQMGSVEGFINLPAILTLVLGLQPELSGGANLEAIRTWDDLWSATVAGLRAAVNAVHEMSLQLDELRAGWPGGHLTASLMVLDCIENARGYTQGGARYNFCNWDAVGIANVADSLVAIRKLCLDSQPVVSLGELKRILVSDWEHEEALRQKVLRELPHFGNDDDEVDQVAVDLVKELAGAFREHTPHRGGEYILGTLAGAENMHILFGRKTPATPDGRRTGEPLADSLGPAQGRDRNGPAAVLNSVAKIPHRLLPTATTTNLKIDPRLLDSQAGIARIAAMLRAHFLTGGQQVQLTLVDRQRLLEAKANPQAHRDVVVRVAGYSAPFTALPADLQDEIIQRTQHAL